MKYKCNSFPTWKVESYAVAGGLVPVKYIANLIAVHSKRNTTFLTLLSRILGIVPDEIFDGF